MTENKTPELPDTLVTDRDGDTLKIDKTFDGNDHVIQAQFTSSLKTVTVLVDPEALLRSLAQHTPHLRIVDAAEHAPEALEVLTNALGNLRAFHGEHNNRKVAKAMLEALAAAGLAVGPAGSGEPSVEQVIDWLNAHGWGITDAAAQGMREALYAGRAPEEPNDPEMWANTWKRQRDAAIERATRAEAQVKELRDRWRLHEAAEHSLSQRPNVAQTVGQTTLVSNARYAVLLAAEEVAQDEVHFQREYDHAVAEVANLRDALEKAEALIGAQMDGLADDVNGVGAKVLRAMHSYAAARQALTEGATSGEGER